jgi:hypothetical protein
MTIIDTFFLLGGSTVLKQYRVLLSYFGLQIRQSFGLSVGYTITDVLLWSHVYLFYRQAF